jgi:hypothetical protein
MRGADNRDMMLLFGMSAVWLLALVVLYGFLRRKSSLGERDLYARMAALIVGSSIAVSLAVALLVEAQRFRAHGDLPSESS